MWYLKTLQRTRRILFPVEISWKEERPMAKGILVLDANKKSNWELCALLRGRDFSAKPVIDLQDFETSLQEGNFIAALMDLDSVPVDNRIIRQLTLKYPGVYFLATSKDRFHPELKDAICYHLYACINKPIDDEELFYWLKTVFEDEKDSGESAEG